MLVRYLGNDYFGLALFYLMENDNYGDLLGLYLIVFNFINGL